MERAVLYTSKACSLSCTRFFTEEHETKVSHNRLLFIGIGEELVTILIEVNNLTGVEVILISIGKEFVAVSVDVDDFASSDLFEFTEEASSTGCLRKEGD